VTIGYWAFALLTLTEHGRLRSLNPVTVVDLTHRLGWRALAVVAAASCLLLAHACVLVYGVALVHTTAMTGLLILTGGWLSGIFWSTFFCRLLGVWCHRSRVVFAD
jgi:hypothetical protein